MNENKYLEKIAGEKIDPDKINVGRMIGRGVLGAAAGHTLGKFVNKRVGAAFPIPAIGAAVFGSAAANQSFKNQVKELREKKAEAMNMLMDQGVDFETASDLVMEKVAFLGTVAGAIGSTDGHRWGGAGMGFIGGAIGANIGHAIGGSRSRVALLGDMMGGGIAGNLYGKHAAKNDLAKKISDKIQTAKAFKSAGL